MGTCKTTICWKNHVIFFKKELILIVPPRNNLFINKFWKLWHLYFLCIFEFFIERVVSLRVSSRDLLSPVSVDRMKFSTKNLLSKCDQIRRKLSHLDTFTEQIFNGKLHFLWSQWISEISQFPAKLLTRTLILTYINIEELPKTF